MGLAKGEDLSLPLTLKMNVVGHNGLESDIFRPQSIEIYVVILYVQMAWGVVGESGICSKGVQMHHLLCHHD